MKRFFLLLLTSLLLHASSSQGAAKHYLFRHLDIVDGMSDNQIRGITMTPDGRIAIKTASIVNLYNGAGFEHFYHDKRLEYKWNHWGGIRNYYDSRGRIWIKERDYLVILDMETNRFVYDIRTELEKMGMSVDLKDLFIDDSKNIWMLTQSNGLFYYDVAKEELVTVNAGGEEVFPREITQMEGQCWIVYSNGMIRLWSYDSREFTRRDTTFLGRIDGTNDRLTLHPSSTHDMWMIYNRSVYLYGAAAGSWREVYSIAGRSNFFTCMDIDSGGNVWLGTSQTGLRVIDAATFEVTTLTGMELETGGVVENDIYSIFVDDNDGVWVGTLFQGVCYYQPGIKKFRLVQVVESETRLSNESIRSFLEQDDGTILIGTARGVSRYNPTTQQIESVYPFLSKDLCLTIYKDRGGRLWIGTFHNGFYCIDGGRVRNYRTEPTLPDRNTGLTGTARDIYEDSKGRFWVSVAGGLGQLYPQTGKIEMLHQRYPQIKDYNIIYKIFPLGDGSLAMTSESGVYFYDPNKDELRVPELDDPQNQKFQNARIKHYFVFRDSRSLEWFGTEEGLRCWDEANGRLYRITVENGLPNNMVTAMQEDSGGSLWISSANGLSRIEITKEGTDCRFSVVSFGTKDGLQSGKFYENSSIKATDGTLYFGGIHGFNTFRPESIAYNRNVIKPIFTSFSLFNTQIRVDSLYNNRVILSKPINRMGEVVLRHNENFIGIELAGLNYVNPSQTYFRYKLENFDPNWTEILTEGSARITYTGLRPGTYRLVVYGANNDKVWGEESATMTIVVKPPYWATTYAFFIYLLLSISLVLLAAYWIVLRNRKRLERQQQLNDRRQKDELDQMKFRFFTNVSHEFRTPLTLIITPLEMLVKQQENPQTKERLSSIYRNAQDLHTLVNQLLDFRKLEMKGEKLNLTKNDITAFIDNVYIQFRDTISSRNIDFNLSCQRDMGVIQFDRHKMHKIVNNLLSNALKFTPNGGGVSLEASFIWEQERKLLRITVADTGRGIGKEELERVFDRFYQIDNGEGDNYYGSGIGLHLVREYVRLHQGWIEVESQQGEGSIFRLYIPTDLEDKKLTEDVIVQIETEEDEQTMEQDSLEQEDDAIDDSHEKTILIVEDNDEFRRFLMDHLGEHFKVLEAADGEQGQQVAEAESPDLIVSDFMMPRMDGIALCRSLKSNIKTSHIPFILLTARSSDDARMEGYDAGADSYISKPFSFDMLLVRIHKLIEQQEKRQELFHRTIEVTPSSITVNSLDEEFIQKALRCVENNMSNTEYSIEHLSADVALHRSHLYRKLRSITGQTPIDFMRLIRLKRSAQLLRSSQYNVSEIADMVGFNTMKYFNKYFKEEFGMTPSQYRATADEELK